MDTQDIRTLKILEEIDQNEAPSQRDLAIKLNVSLGLVNSFIKRLAKKGYFKVTTIPANRVRYILTPKGAAEKTRLTYEYIQMSFRYYKNARRRLSELFSLFERQQINRIVFFGASELAEIAYISLQETPITLTGIVDSYRVGEKILGFRIVSPENLTSLDFQKIVITAMESRGSVMKEILDRGIDRSRIALL